MTAHTLANSDLRCTSCGYGVARLRPPARCPMCAGTRWQHHRQRRQNGVGTDRVEHERLRPGAVSVSAAPLP